MVRLTLLFAPPYGAIAQLGERNTGSVEVGGSIPPGSTKQDLTIQHVTGRRKRPDPRDLNFLVPFV